MRPVLVLVVVATAAGCHVTTRTHLTHVRASRAEPHPDQARAQPPTIALADGGFRLVEPLQCPSDEFVEVEPELQTARRPNLATFVVGVVAVAAGGVAGISGLVSDDPADNPATYAGIGLFGLGLPFAIGPWLGNRVDSTRDEVRTERRAGPEVACGSRPVGGGFVLLTIGERQLYSGVGADGAVITSPFTLFDAFDPSGAPAFAVHAELGGRGGRRVIDKVFEAGALAPWRDGFLAATHLDVGVEPFRALPKVSSTAIRVGHVLFGSVPTLHVVVTLANAGPGHAWQVRARITAASRELDGRIVYVGHIAPKASAIGELWVALSPEADDAIRRGTIELGFRLTDAHQTMPTEPIEFRGPVIDDGFQ